MAFELKLPLFLKKSHKSKLLSAAIVGSAGLMFYLVPNHIHLFEPQLLRMTWIDQNVPFLPHTLWVYLSEVPLYFCVFFLMKDPANANKYLYSWLSLMFFSSIIFWFWPTTYPRELYPLPANLDSLTSFAFGLHRAADSPANCAPSLHVSSCYLSAFVFLDEQREKFIVFFLWATAIALSTLTTKQHYILDVVTGFLMAVIFYWFFHKRIRYKIFSGTQPKR